jgi:bifunctional DNase/RNase
MEIEVKIRALMMDPNSGTPIIILKDVQSDTMLPIWVGAYEANAIALEIEKIAPPRPMTHDLLRNLIVELGVQVDRVVVTSLRDNTFFAVIEMHNSDGDKMVLDSRPSDAIALALRADCPIYVDMEVIKASRNTLPTEESEEAEMATGEEEWPDVIGEAGDYRCSILSAYLCVLCVKGAGDAAITERAQSFDAENAE